MTEQAGVQVCEGGRIRGLREALSSGISLRVDVVGLFGTNREQLTKFRRSNESTLC